MIIKLIFNYYYKFKKKKCENYMISFFEKYFIFINVVTVILLIFKENALEKKTNFYKVKVRLETDFKFVFYYENDM